MKQFATITPIGRVTNFLFEQKANIEALEEQVTRGQFSMTLKEFVARGQQLEANVLVKAVTLYLGKRLDVYWGVVKEV